MDDFKKILKVLNISASHVYVGILRPALLIKMLELGDGILLSDETNVNWKKDIDSLKPFAATLTEQQYKLFIDFEQASNRAWASE